MAIAASNSHAAHSSCLARSCALMVVTRKDNPAASEAIISADVVSRKDAFVLIAMIAARAADKNPAR